MLFNTLLQRKEVDGQLDLQLALMEKLQEFKLLLDILVADFLNSYGEFLDLFMFTILIEMD